MKCLCNSTLLIAFILALNGAFEASASNETEFCSASQPIDQQCGKYAYNILKPLLTYLKYLQTKVNDNNIVTLIKTNEHLNEELTSLKNTLKEKNELLDAYRSNIADLRESNSNLRIILKSSTSNAQLDSSTTKSLSNELTKLQAQTATDVKNIEIFLKNHISNSEKCEMERRNETEVVTKLEACAQELIIKSNKINELQGQINKLQDQITNDAKKATTEQIPKANSCKALAGGEHEIQVPGLKPFEVLCSGDHPVGKGWIIIQQRINGQEDFERNWNSYRDGFGYFWGDFFLGLTKIHHITHSQRYELYIYMEKFNTEWFAARYDNFRVGSEADLFELQTLGNYTWTNIANDKMRYQEHMKFTTFDRDNDKWMYGNCAKDAKSGGWWYNNCATCNLNGKYFQTAIDDGHSAHWLGWRSLKKIQMLIRPLN
ncbi:maker636 [Drosophila busckii]|uniref:Maker636 n=1 Tax=Drosophila busckii TaxID=30019 RepID=A0A0M5J3C1_DROBS|nr:maker636 [Drosophila busckii]